MGRYDNPSSIIRDLPSIPDDLAGAGIRARWDTGSDTQAHLHITCKNGRICENFTEVIDRLAEQCERLNIPMKVDFDQTEFGVPRDNGSYPYLNAIPDLSSILKEMNIHPNASVSVPSNTAWMPTPTYTLSTNYSSCRVTRSGLDWGDMGGIVMAAVFVFGVILVGMVLFHPTLRTAFLEGMRIMWAWI